MERTSRNGPWRWFLCLILAALTSACVDGGVFDPDPQRPLSPGAGDILAVTESGPGASASSALRRPTDPDACSNLNVPAASRLAAHLYARGVQIYRWNGAGWSFEGPSALLYADAGGHGVVGSHYGGPTWESASGGTVVGSVLDRCSVDAGAVPWLLLEATAAGPGIFRNVTFIKRVNTVGGTAPSVDGTFPGEEARVAYTAEYVFYAPK